MFPDSEPMQQNGVISYRGESEHTFDVGGGLFVRIVRVDRNFARLYFARLDVTTDTSTSDVDIPPEYSLVDISEGSEDPFVVPLIGNQWIVVFSAKYVLKKAGANVLFLHPQRQQSIQTSYPRRSAS